MERLVLILGWKESNTPDQRLKINLSAFSICHHWMTLILTTLVKLLDFDRNCEKRLQMNHRVSFSLWFVSRIQCALHSNADATILPTPNADAANVEAELSPLPLSRIMFQLQWLSFWNISTFFHLISTSISSNGKLTLMLWTWFDNNILRTKNERIKKKKNQTSTKIL